MGTRRPFPSGLDCGLVSIGRAAPFPVWHDRCRCVSAGSAVLGPGSEVRRDWVPPDTGKGIVMGPVLGTRPIRWGAPEPCKW